MIHPESTVDPTAEIGARTIVARGVTSGARVTFGNDCWLRGEKLVVKKGAVIDDAGRIHGCHIGEKTRLRHGCTLQP